MLVCLFMMLNFVIPGAAQTVTSETVKAALKKPIHLIPNGTAEKNTLRTLLASMREQTGLTMEAESFLLDRTVIVTANGQNAGELLNALAELNDWVWNEKADHHILLSRPRYVAPTNLGEVPKAMQRCLPVDMRRYLGIGVAPEDLFLPENSRFHGKEADLLKQSPEQIISESNKNRLSIASQKADDAILQTLSLQHFREGDLSYQEWSKELREQVIQRLVLQALEQEANPVSTGLTISALQPFQTDLSKAFISVNGGIFISSYLPPPPNHPDGIHKTGFGAIIPEDKRPPP
jgi:hypothetical protein